MSKPKQTKKNKPLRSFRIRKRTKITVVIKKPEGNVVHTVKQSKNTVSLKKYLKLKSDQFKDV